MNVKWSPWTHSTNWNGPVPTALVRDSAESAVSLIEDVEVLEEVEHARPRLVGLQHDGVLVGRLDAVEPRALRRQRADEPGELRIAHAQQVVLDVVAGELATGVELHALAQVQLELAQVAADVPAFGEHRLRLELVVVLDESVVGEESDVDGGLGDLVSLDGAEVANHAGIQRPAGFSSRRCRLGS